MGKPARMSAAERQSARPLPSVAAPAETAALTANRMASGGGGGSGGSEQNAPLPPGWTRAWSKRANAEYYTNSATGETVWKKPQSVPSPSLPAGWSRAHSKRTNAFYYVNSATGERSWELPAMAAAGDSGAYPRHVQLMPDDSESRGAFGPQRARLRQVTSPVHEALRGAAERAAPA